MGGGDPMLRRHAESDFRFAAKLWQLGCASFIVMVVLCVSNNTILGAFNLFFAIFCWWMSGKWEQAGRAKQRKAER